MVDFKSFHRMEGNRKLQQLLKIFEENGAIDDNLLQAIKRYHTAMMYKLQCAKYFIDELDKMLNDLQPQALFSAPDKFIFDMNRNIDGFFYSGGSAIDLIAREVLLYFNHQLPDNVYFRFAEKKISASHCNHAILPKLATSEWLKKFRDYRNALTHEVLLATEIQTNVVVDGETITSTFVIPLPDDPRVAPIDRTFKNHPSVSEYTKKYFKKILSLGNQIYLEIEKAAWSEGSLPL